MKKDEAIQIASVALAELRTLPYSELAKRIDEAKCVDVVAPSGEKCQFETQIFWDDKKGGNIRVTLGVVPVPLRLGNFFGNIVNLDFIKAADGTFIGEELERILIPQLEKRFLGRGLRVERTPYPMVVFPGLSPDVGDLTIRFEGEELIVEIEKITHSHFANYTDSLNTQQKMNDVASQVIDFLDDLFSDRVLLYSKGMAGGWILPFDGTVPEKLREANLFLWSGPLKEGHSSVFSASHSKASEQTTILFDPRIGFFRSMNWKWRIASGFLGVVIGAGALFNFNESGLIHRIIGMLGAGWLLWMAFKGRT